MKTFGWQPFLAIECTNRNEWRAAIEQGEKQNITRKISSTSAFCVHFKRSYPRTHLHRRRHLNNIHSPYYARSAIFLSRKKIVNKYLIVGILMRLSVAFFYVLHCSPRSFSVAPWKCHVNFPFRFFFAIVYVSQNGGKSWPNFFYSYQVRDAQ